MPILLKQLHALVRELKRRKVVRAVAAYAVAAAGLISFSGDLTEALRLPDGTPYVIVIGCLIGLPVVVAVSWLYEIVPDLGPAEASAPAVAPAVAPERAREPLPAPGTAFIGRRRELAELVELLRDPATRLVTVIGAGGIGKTRLALSAAQQLEPEFAHGVRYVPLSGLPTADLLPPALAESLGVSLSRRADAALELLDYLREKQLLLVLDNFDHLTAGASVLSPILESAPGVRVLVTSRERLNLLPEILLQLDGLPVAHEGQTESDAVELFVAAARRQDRHFQLDGANHDAVHRICALVGGVPLAIELAAAWVRVMSCAEIHHELALSFDLLSSTAPDAVERHRSLRATFASSWRLLNAAEQRAVAYLSVIRSDFDRSTALAVADADIPLLRGLLDKSFLTRAGGQFLMLEMVRQYARERLEEQQEQEADARQRHLHYFAELLHALEYDAQRWDPKAFARIVEDVDDVRAAWSFAVETRNTDAFLRAARTLYHLYDARGWAKEGVAAFSDAAAALSRSHAALSAQEQLAYTTLILRAGALHHRLGQHGVAEPLLRQALDSARSLGASGEIVFALHRLGANQLAMGHTEAAQLLFEETLTLGVERGMPFEIGWSQAHLGNVALTRGEYDHAARLYAQALPLLREEQDRHGMWVATNNLGVIAAMRKQHEEARQRFAEGLALQRELGNQGTVATLLHNLGCNALDAGDVRVAREYLEQGLETSERMGLQSMIAMTLTALSDVHVRQQDLPAARRVVVRALRTAAAARNQPAALEAVLALARVRLGDGDRDGAAAAAALVARHEASGGDTRKRAQAMLAELNAAEKIIARNTDLDAFISEAVAEAISMTV
ncbi:MAG TPA: tetratricopeptide repeat protein [Longimicrobiales bacterium]|nr:tetratricopeptide repeat protein [Longimicrobiales bacterium]